MSAADIDALAAQRHLEDRERLLLTSRVVSVGEMASMLAHELNQPIGSIANLLRGLRARLNRQSLDPATALEAIDKALEQALYAAGVIARVRSFVDQRQPRVERLDLPGLAQRTLELLDWEIRRGAVEVATDFDPATPPVSGDPVMVRQVLVNLARNALDAMRGREARRLSLCCQGRPGEAWITIADTGPGVAAEQAEKLFSPFFTTKADGMGLGLGVCRSIVELHGGRLWFEPAAGGGAAFHLALPAAEKEASP